MQVNASPSGASAGRVHVELGDRSYDVVIGRGVRRLLREFVPARARRAVVVTQRAIGVNVEPGVSFMTYFMGDGERAKSLSAVEEMCRAFVNFGLTRHDVVIAVGGGVVSDCAGFAAASYHRGVDLINVATTLLGQVDAAIGGKTAVNLPEGKNLVGAFWQPRAVLCDTEVLSTLPERERRSGLGEMAKYAFLGVENLPELSLEDQVRACCRLKAEFVSDDEREGDRRMLLNYGHTLAHGLEALGLAELTGEEAVSLRHGEAVAIGLIFAAHLARRLGRIGPERVQFHYDVVESYGLPTRVPVAAHREELLRAMGRDKKATDGLIFILDGPRGPEVVKGVPEDDVLFALDAVSSP